MKKNQLFIETEYARELGEYKIPRYNELPDFDLYMEQLIEILDKYLNIFRIPGEEKMITATMVNNYVKQKVIHPPKNKKYSKSQLLYLIVIGILKQVWSISETAQVLKLYSEQYSEEIAYNYMCTELESALQATFITRNFSAESCATKITPLSEAVRSALMAFTNRIYSKKVLHHLGTFND